VDPINIYGVSKAAGEMAVRATAQRHLIIRVSGLYGVGGMRTSRGNFVETMLRLGARGEPVSVVDRQTLTPTATADVADVVRELLTRDATGTYHVTNCGECSWYQFAREIFRLAGMRVDLRPISQDLRPTPARRPVYSVLAHDALLKIGMPDLRPWQEALASYMAQRASAVRG
jgi:dTDP-4-dehydrorhamnose reductase